ncbi:MAG: hypothetical protein OEM38_06115 [Gammaproteobacteria bacterium]|nr:hypothetical protein [Gammaproteobacteria bacterium]
MPRIVIISLVILCALTWSGYKAKESGYQNLSIALFTAAVVYGVILSAGFFGLIG